MSLCDVCQANSMNGYINHVATNGSSAANRSSTCINPPIP